ncbi:hypothetical protein ACFQ0M_29960 [Kitasatospora aburaviensis]
MDTEYPEEEAHPDGPAYRDEPAHPGDGPAPADPRFHPSDGPPVELAPYTIPAVPATGWDPASSPGDAGSAAPCCSPCWPSRRRSRCACSAPRTPTRPSP